MRNEVAARPGWQREAMPDSVEGRTYIIRPLWRTSPRKDMPQLKPCPLCGRPPDRFVVGQEHIEVIACAIGCKPDWNTSVVHITSAQVNLGLDDLGEVWNSIRVEDGPAGKKRVWFDWAAPSPPSFEPEGAYLKWSPTISARKVLERSAARNRDT